MVTSLPVASTEFILFLVTLLIMIKQGDLQAFFKPHNKNWVLIIPLGATLVPLFSLGRGAENSLPTLLAVPSIFNIILFFLLHVYLSKSLAKNER
jgi:hypothetical protein